MRIPFRYRTLASAAALLVAVSLFLLWRRGPARQPEAVRWPTFVSTLAGVGAPGLAEGRGREVAFADPFGIAVDAAGNTYVADAGDNNVIWRIDPDGLATVIAGGREGFADGDGPSAAFNTPSGLALDASGNLLVADTGNHAIRRVTPAGSVTTVAGNGEPGGADGRGGEARFNGPIGVAVAPDGSIVVADTYNDCIRLIAPDGQVSTIAGGGAPGYRDGAAAQALFDTPSGVAVDAAGVIYVADTGNDAIRRISRDGQVTTIAMPGSVGAPFQRVGLFRPVGIALKRGREEFHNLPPGSGKPNTDIAESEIPPDPFFVTDGAGRVVALSAAGEVTVLAGTPAGSASDLPAGAGPTLRFLNPTGIAAASDGSLRVADSDSYMVRRLTRPGDRVPSADVDFTPVPWLSAATLRILTFPWPLDPQHEWHELAATLGEARGSPGGDGRERLHSGIDVRGPVGTIVRAVLEEKVQRPIGATGFHSVNEALRIGVVSYVHVRVGRTAGGAILDPERLAMVNDDLGKPARIRIRRGTRFHVGDAIGTVNNLAHVHLDVGPRGGEINPLSLLLEPFHDHIPPTIAPRGVELYSEAGDRIAPPRKGPLPVSGRVAIVVDAYDRVDGNRARRKLGVYKLGYQILRKDGTPAPGFGEPRMTVEFDRLPADADAPRVIYADGSGIRAYGSRTTRFRYIVTNSLHEGRVTQGLWDTSHLPAGDYRLRVIASDWSGNKTSRDVAVRVLR